MYAKVHLLLFLVSIPAISQERAIHVSLIELIANPERFDRKTVTVRGYLVFENQPKHAVQASLWLDQEHANNLLDSMLVVAPSASMLRNQEKLNRMYVLMTGVYHGVRHAGDGHLAPGIINQIQSCTLWSNPTRPIGEPGIGPKQR